MFKDGDVVEKIVGGQIMTIDHVREDITGSCLHNQCSHTFSFHTNWVDKNGAPHSSVVHESEIKNFSSEATMPEVVNETPASVSVVSSTVPEIVSVSTPTTAVEAVSPAPVTVAVIETPVVETPVVYQPVYLVTDF